MLGLPLQRLLLRGGCGRGRVALSEGWGRQSPTHEVGVDQREVGDGKETKDTLLSAFLSQSSVLK